MIRTLACIGLAFLISGCSDGGQTAISFPAFATATAPLPLDIGGWTVTLDEASFLFGPAYFCAAATGAATLCTTAIAEIRQESLIDALDPNPQSLGDVQGLTGTIRSASYDHGIHWFVTEIEPGADNIALGGHSAVFAGQAQRGVQTIQFDARIDLPPPVQGERAVIRVLEPVTLSNENVKLDVQFDISQWISNIDFDGASNAGMTSLVIKQGSKEHSGFVSSMSNLAPLEFIWSGTGVTTP
jgi:hypothetical protein